MRTVGALVLAAGGSAAAAAVGGVGARRDTPASWLLVPYLAWSLFATALNASVRARSGPAG